MSEKNQLNDEELTETAGGKHNIPRPEAPNTGMCPMCNTSDRCVIVNFKRTYDNCKDCKAVNS